MILGKASHIFLLSGVIAITLPACSSTSGALKDDPRVNRVAHRQHAPDPTYHRLTWVQPPQVSPQREVRLPAERIAVKQIIEFDLEKGTLKEAAHMLGAILSYHVYCPSTLSKKPFSYRGLGTIDELAETIASIAGITISIDHDTQSVRFLERGQEKVKARLYYKG